MGRWRWAGCAVLLASACGGGQAKPAPAVPVVAAPASAPRTVVAPPAPFDASLPKSAIVLGAADSQAAAAFLGSKATQDLLKPTTGFDFSQLAELGVDPSRPILFAQLGLDDAQQKALEAVIAAGGVNGVPLVRQLVGPHPRGLAFRIVVPVVDAARAKAAASKLFTTSGFDAAGEDTFETPATDNPFAMTMRVELATVAGALVIDEARTQDGKASIAALRADVRAGHAAAPTLAASRGPSARVSSLGYRARDGIWPPRRRGQ